MFERTLRAYPVNYLHPMLALLLSFPAATAALGQAHAMGSGDLRTGRWREDLHYLSATLSEKGRAVSAKQGITTRGEIDFGQLYPHFQSDIDALSGDVPELDDGAIVLRLMKIIATANVDHNQVGDPIGIGFFPRLPLSFAWFADGLAIVSASKEYEASLGTRVLRIGDKTPEQVLSLLTPYISHENQYGLRERSLPLLRCRIMLAEAGVVDSSGQVAFTLQRRDGTVFSLTARTADPRVPQTTMSTGLHIPSHLSESQPEEGYYWFQRLKDGSLYIQYDACMNDPKFHFSDFAAKVLTDADLYPVRRVIVDLRKNGGGDSRIIGPLVRGLRERLSKLGRVYVLIGSGTASSAMDNASELRGSLQATLVGEPTSEKPSGYGEIKSIILPNSNLNISYSTKWFGQKTDNREALMPDIPIPTKLSDALDGRDPALDAVLAMP